MEEELDLNKIKDIFSRLSNKDMAIIVLFLMLLLMYVIYERDIQACNTYYQNIMINMTRLTTSLW